MPATSLRDPAQRRGGRAACPSSARATSACASRRRRCATSPSTASSRSSPRPSASLPGKSTFATAGSGSRGGAGRRRRHLDRARPRERRDVYEVRSRYLIAADGAGSRVRRSLGIEMQGPPRIQSFLMIHFGASLREMVKDRPGVLHFVILDPRRAASFVAHDIDREWVYMHDFDPGPRVRGRLRRCALQASWCCGRSARTCRSSILHKRLAGT